MDITVSRRRMLALLGASGGALLAACQQAAPATPAKPTEAPKPAAPASPAAAASPAAKPAASPAASPAAGASSSAAPSGAISEADWNSLVAAAKQEGKLSIATYSGTGYRQVIEDFKKAFPGIEVEHQQFQSSSRDFVPRLLQEHKAGLYTWDLATMPLQEMMRQVKVSDGLQPVRPLLVRADVLDDKNWNGGFEKGFDDNDKRWGYSAFAVRFPTVWINTDQVKESEMKTLKDLTDPKWRGKIVAADPRTKGSAFVPATVMRVKTGSDDIMKAFFKDQDPLLSTDARQLTEFMVRGRGLIGFGAVDKVILADFTAQGLGKNLKNIDFPEADFLSSVNNHLWYLAKAPHPKAAQVFANWLLTKDGQISYSTNVKVNSRRTDVPPADPEAVPTPGVEYISSDLESFIPEQAKTQEIAKSLLD